MADVDKIRDYNKVKLTDEPSLSSLKNGCTMVYTINVLRALANVYTDNEKITNDDSIDSAKKVEAKHVMDTMESIFDELTNVQDYKNDTFKITDNLSAKLLSLEKVKQIVEDGMVKNSLKADIVFDKVKPEIFFDLTNTTLDFANLEKILTSADVSKVLKEVRSYMPNMNFTYDADEQLDADTQKTLSKFRNNYGQVFVGVKSGADRNYISIDDYIANRKKNQNTQNNQQNQNNRNTQNTQQNQNSQQGAYSQGLVFDSDFEVQDLISDLNHNIRFARMTAFEAYLMAYDFVTQDTEEESEEEYDVSDASSKHAEMLSYICNNLVFPAADDQSLKVDVVSGRKNAQDQDCYYFCKVQIKDTRYDIKGVYAADPATDVVCLPQNDEERKIMGHVLSFSKKASEDCDDEDGKRLAGSEVLNALIPPQLIPDYGVGRFFNPESNTYETNGNVRTRFPASAPVVSLQAYRDGLKRGFMYRFNGTHTTRQINSMVEEKMTNSRLAAWASGVCFGKEYNRWYNRVNLFRPEKYKMGVANTSLARATKHYARKFRLDKVHNVLRSVLVTIVEGAVGLLSNIRGGIAARRARRSGSTPTPTPTP